MHAVEAFVYRSLYIINNQGCIVKFSFIALGTTPSTGRGCRCGRRVVGFTTTYMQSVPITTNIVSLNPTQTGPDFPKTVGPSVLTDRNAVGPTISKYISDRMSGKT